MTTTATDGTTTLDPLLDEVDDPSTETSPRGPSSDPEADLEKLLNSFRLLVLHHSRVLGHQGAEYGLGATDIRFLAYVSATGDAVTPKRAAEYLELSTGAMTNLVDRLVASGHLDRKPNPADRRSVIVSRTAKGVEVSLAIGSVYRESFREAFAAHQWRDLADGFLDLGAALDRNGALPDEA